ncbi:hypothetical protein HGRIS_008134 [Hohenbuehelia grisea]|uniref:Protein kinase domain-containing protein n=1 Tax=Hohenbuehelia grisea TaxID=104357 RepID=A0ABR3J8H0_9AGAR
MCLTMSQPENILLYSPGPYPRIQIADFGLARPKAYQETLNVCGTVSYLPPEGILALDNQHLGYVGMPSDCWSAGVILFIMLAGYHPFDYECPFDSDLADYVPESQDGDSAVSQTYWQNENRVKQRIIDGQVDFRESIWSLLDLARSLVNQLLVRDHLQRASVDIALEHSWITTELSELETAYQERILS